MQEAGIVITFSAIFLVCAAMLEKQSTARALYFIGAFTLAALANILVRWPGGG